MLIERALLPTPACLCTYSVFNALQGGRSAHIPPDVSCIAAVSAPRSLCRQRQCDQSSSGRSFEVVSD